MLCKPVPEALSDSLRAVFLNFTLCLCEGQTSWDWNCKQLCEPPCEWELNSGTLEKTSTLSHLSSQELVNYQFQVIHSLIPKGFNAKVLSERLSELLNFDKGSPHISRVPHWLEMGALTSEPSLSSSHCPFLPSLSKRQHTGFYFSIYSLYPSFLFLVLKLILRLSNVTCWTGQNPQSPLDLRLLKTLPVPMSHWIQEQSFCQLHSTVRHQ